MKKFADILCEVVIVGVLCFDALAQNVTTKPNSPQSQQSPADSLYNAFPAQTVEQSDHVMNGNEILDLGLKAFLEFPQDTRAERTLNTLAWLPMRLSKADMTVYQNKLHDRISTLLTAPDTSVTVREGIIYLDAANEIAVQTVNRGALKSDLEPLRKKIDLLETSHVQSPWIAPNTKWMESNYGDLLADVDLDAAKTFWEKMSAGSDQGQAELAKGKLTIIEFKQGRLRLPIKFTAADGRQVDLAALRGKVVLIDFWATWCPPCTAELPDLKNLYEKYHDRGFEIIGISCEDADVQSGDSEIVRTQKLETNKSQFLKFVAAKELPWPQYYDGKGEEQNEYARRLGVVGLPVMFLVDQDGKLIATGGPNSKLDIGTFVQKQLLTGTGK